VRVIGVVDLLGGRAVHARAGRRETYRPVRTVAGTPIEPGDALALARVYTDLLGIAELYVADLDAIMGRPSQDMLVTALAALGTPLWLDEAVSSVDRARHALALGARQVVVGLETLASYDRLAAICADVGRDRVAFSLDLRDGEPLVRPDGTISREAPDQIASRAVSEGAAAVIVLDVARVGTGSGPDFALMGRVRHAVPNATLLAGGGVRGPDDLARLADVGCDGALVATALQDGRLGAADVLTAHHYRSASR
jgi:phosphoribosylformimino-5-aminoimidazole carboxamide ribotide isomerase